MFKRSANQPSQQPAQVERVTSVLGVGINWTGNSPEKAA